MVTATAPAALPRRSNEEGRLDPLRHPDLTRVARRLRHELDETLDAEQHAAREAARRRRSLREVLLECRDRDEQVVIATTRSDPVRGRIASVGLDHVELSTPERTVIVALGQIAVVERT